MRNGFVILISLALLSCSTTGERRTSALSTLPIGTCEAIEGFFKQDLERYQASVDEASKEYQEEQWRVETADPKASPEKMSKLFEVLQRKTYDRVILASTLALAEASKELSVESCPMKRNLLRAKKLLETAILTSDAVARKEKENQDKQDALQSKSNAYRITVPGEKEPISKALLSKKIGSTPVRADREKLFKEFGAGRAVKWIEWGFKDLVKARNEEGKLAGFENYYEYKFFRSGLDLKNYRERVREVKTKLAPKVRRVLSQMGRTEKISQVEAWDIRYLREKNSSGEINDLLKDLSENSVLDVAKRFWSALGIDVDSYHFTMDLYPRDGKNTHAFAMGVVPPHVNEKGEVLPEPKPDIRFLANLKKPVKWDDISTVIHELGHAIHYGEIRQPLAIFRGFGSVETEAIAMTVERMAESNEFFEKELPGFTGATLEKLKPILKKQEKVSRTEQAFVLLRQVFFSDFEYELYRNPDQDLGALWARLHKEYWGVGIDSKIADWDVDHFVMAPVYVENYAIGILMVEQLYASILKDFKTSYQSLALGNKLKKVYFAPGYEFDYLEYTQRFSGKPLTATAALKLID
jgi:hypothetical protein